EASCGRSRGSPCPTGAKVRPMAMPRRPPRTLRRGAREHSPRPFEILQAMAPLDRIETRKDTLQVAIESGATHVGQIMGIVVGAVRDVTHELGDWATDVFEM